jgi:branched-chain amino acid transport system ATP-binding protein
MPLLQARAITKRFGGLTAVKDVDFSLDGGIAAIIGPNGAGKTTFFNVLTGLYVPDGGEVLLGDTSLVGLRPDQITTLGVCRTFQNIRLFKAMTAVENVLVGMHARVRLGVWDVLIRGGRFKSAEGERGATRARSSSAWDSVASSTWKRATSRMATSAASSSRARSPPRRACSCSMSRPRA